MAVSVFSADENGIAFRHGVRPGHVLLAINNHEITDVLDYRFYMTGISLHLLLENEHGETYEISLRKAEYADLGIEFESYLIDKQKSCRNKCVFCFIDQLPPGMRDSLYFKDDDSRMSFLFGNYITLTNLKQRDIERILQMHISPVNISVHTTNPELRVCMMKNKRAGEVLSYLPLLTNAGIKVNTQIVLCPGYNDGAELERSLADLCKLVPNLQSISVVPIGLTRFRDGLAKMRPFTSEEAANVIATINRFGDEMLEKHGERICWPGDEFFLLAGIPMPPDSFYGDYPQLANGVGMTALLQHEFSTALSMEDSEPANRHISIATGAAAYPQLLHLAHLAMQHFPGLVVDVYRIKNDFFGNLITVSGLICGCDLLKNLQECDLGEQLLLPKNMLRHEGDLFLDGVSLEELVEKLATPIRVVETDGFELLDAMLGRFCEEN